MSDYERLNSGLDGSPKVSSPKQDGGGHHGARAKGSKASSHKSDNYERLDSCNDDSLIRAASPEADKDDRSQENEEESALESVPIVVNDDASADSGDEGKEVTGEVKQLLEVWEGRGSQDLGPFTPYAPTRVLGAVRYWHSVYDALCHTSIAYAKPSAVLS